MKKIRTLNAAGVKNSSNRWRTFNGEIYIMWTVEQFEGQRKLYTAAGVRNHLIDGCEIFIHEDDKALARSVDNR